MSISHLVYKLHDCAFFSSRRDVDDDGADADEDHRQRRVEGDPVTDEQREADSLRGSRRTAQCQSSLRIRVEANLWTTER